MYAEYVGLTAEVIALIEQFRQTPNESKSDIIGRQFTAALSGVRSSKMFEFGQGAKVPVGEPLFLFLSEEAKRRNEPDATAEVRSDGFFLEGKKVEPSKGSVLQPAMKIIQERKGHRNGQGELISLNAWRQWYVVRDRKFIPLTELKDPTLARKRGRDASNITLEDLGL